MKRRLLNIKDTSEYLGLCPDTIRELISRRRIPFVNISQGMKPVYRFDLYQVDLWVERLPGLSVEDLEDD
jgi:excisionase family DNA binding protein